ncbi:yrdC domain-containing protein [Cucumis melo var. makuwa]|uniref:Threonylcarbamoyl-AMP synthase n=1 Tax=Cucumis melo var. makuwa TaxID=1194695 RepID=A0A5D3C4N1_CUCMM|nr:yrdC domain-containing protein [Cucumis melo var. makuwa]
MIINVRSNLHPSTASSLSSLRSFAPIRFPSPPSASRFDGFRTSRRLQVLAMVVKRSPKRLKYSAPRFTKVLSLLTTPVCFSASLCPRSYLFYMKLLSLLLGIEYLVVQVELRQEGSLIYVKAESGEDGWKLDPIVNLLKEGAVGVIPTDTVYGIVCDLKNPSAIERMRRIKNIEPSKPLSILCHSFRDIDKYTTGFPRGDGQGHSNIFRMVKHCLPGPYTFILTASKELPKHCIRYGTTTAKYASRKNVGVRIPDDAICQAILEKMDNPLISTSVKSPKENEWLLDPVVIADIYGQEGLDFVVDGGVRVADPSTVVDMTITPPKILRQGKGARLPWMVAEGDDEPNLGEDIRT